MRKSPAPGIRWHGKRWQVCAKYRGERVYASWDSLEELAEMLEWQADEVAKMRLATPTAGTGTFAADVQRYLALESVRKMTTYKERVQHLGEWVAIFGAMRRRKIAALPIEEQRDAWLSGKDPYSASAVNHRLRALSNVWTKLDGRKAPNPVSDVAECEEPDPQARGLTYDVVEAILAAIPDNRIGKRKDDTYTTGIARPSQSKARLRVIAYTGLAHAQLKALKREDVDFERATMRLVARRKGRKMQRAQDRPLPQTLPLIPQAVAAFREFDRLKCWGPFSNSSMWKAFDRACRLLKLSGLRPYDFRHSFGTLVFAESHSLRTTGELLNHRSERTTKRYTIAAVAPHVAAAVALIRARLDAGESGAHRGVQGARGAKIP